MRLLFSILSVFYVGSNLPMALPPLELGTPYRQGVAILSGSTGQNSPSRAQIIRTLKRVRDGKDFFASNPDVSRTVEILREKNDVELAGEFLKTVIAQTKNGLDGESGDIIPTIMVGLYQHNLPLMERAIASFKTSPIPPGPLSSYGNLKNHAQWLYSITEYGWTEWTKEEDKKAFPDFDENLRRFKRRLFP